jgi:hypothetical protein
MWKRPVWGLILSTAFAVALTFTPLPEHWRILIVATAWSVCLLATAGWIISNWKERRASQPQFTGRDYNELLRELVRSKQQDKPAEKQAKPARLKVSHDIECVVSRTFVPPEGPPIKGIMHHLRVESVLKSRAINCQAVLRRLEKNGKSVVSACNLPFKFHPSQQPDSHIRTINYREEQYLELLWLPWERDAEIMVDLEFADLEHKPLDKQAKYSAFIVFTGDNIDGQEVVMDVHYEGRGWDVSKRPSSEGPSQKNQQAEKRNR